MNGKQHLVTGVTFMSMNVATYHKIITDWTDVPTVIAVKDFANFVVPSDLIHVIPSTLLFLAGLLLPDCDRKNSLLGREIHVPFKHRTWTHTIWFILPFLLLGMLYKPLFLLAYGIFLHLFIDSFSRQGVCWFNPYGYKTFNNARVKDKHFIYLYKSDASAWILCGILLAIAIFYVLGAFRIISSFAECVDSLDIMVQKIVYNVIMSFKSIVKV